MADYFKFKKIRKLGMKLLWLILLLLLLNKLIPLIPHPINFIISSISHLWIFIERRKFIYIILNFIIISILISSSSFTTKLRNFLLKIHKNSSRNNISSLISQTSQKILFPFDDDTWWARIEETECLLPLDETSSFEPPGVESLQEEVEMEVDTLDDTWKAIMEAKNKGSGTHLKKSETWTSGDRGGDRGKIEFKKWSTLKKDSRDGSDIDRDRGFGLTYHDEFKKRADAFIARVNLDMRLQRLESDQRLSDTINRGL